MAANNPPNVLNTKEGYLLHGNHNWSILNNFKKRLFSIRSSHKLT